MKYKVCGCELREGDYEGNHFKYYLLYGVSPTKKDNEIFGVCPVSIKVKAKFVEDNQINIKSLNQKVVDIYYDSFKNVAKIDVIE